MVVPIPANLTLFGGNVSCSCCNGDNIRKQPGPPAAEAQPPPKDDAIIKSYQSVHFKGGEFRPKKSLQQEDSVIQKTWEVFGAVLMQKFNCTKEEVERRIGDLQKSSLTPTQYYEILEWAAQTRLEKSQRPTDSSASDPSQVVRPDSNVTDLGSGSPHRKDSDDPTLGLRVTSIDGMGPREDSVDSTPGLMAQITHALANVVLGGAGSTESFASPPKDQERRDSQEDRTS